MSTEHPDSDSYSEKEFLERAKRSLDEGLNRIPLQTLGRLRQARREAVRQGRVGGFDIASWFPAPMKALAMASVAVLALATALHFSPGGMLSGPGEELELVASAEDMELSEELEFYAWLAEEELDAG